MSGEAGRKIITVAPAPGSSRFLCHSPPLWLCAPNQNHHATQAKFTGYWSTAHCLQRAIQIHKNLRPHWLFRGGTKYICVLFVLQNFPQTWSRFPDLHPRVYITAISALQIKANTGKVLTKSFFLFYWSTEHWKICQLGYASNKSLNLISCYSCNRPGVCRCMH